MPGSARLTAPLRQKYRLLALALALGMPEEAAAAQAHIEVETLRRYMRDPRFEEYLNKFNQDIEDRVIERQVSRTVRVTAKLQREADRAADRIISLVDEADKDSVRLQASKAILRQAGVDLDKTFLGDQLSSEDAERKLKRITPSFFKLHEEATEELKSLPEECDSEVSDGTGS